MNPAIFPERQRQLQSLITSHNLNAVAVNPGPDLTYLAGLEFHLMERPVLMIIPASGPPVLILPELEQAKVSALDFEVRRYFYNEDISSWSVVFQKALQETGLQTGNLGIVPRRLRFLELSYLENACPGLAVVSAQSLLSNLRMTKGAEEIQFMGEAARIAECALAATLSAIKPGVSEKEIASKLVGRLLHHGSDPELPFFPIVSFGENTANPHAAPSDRLLKPGDLVLIDWGASYQGYYSDITRTFAMGDLNPELEEIAKFVLGANTAGRNAVKPGVPASEIDQAARKVIEDAGYGEFFIHRTGHGLGREAHEEPYISLFDQTTLKPGMTFTIEPGIYLPNRGGVRIEDDIVVTETGCTSLTDLPRELIQLKIPE